MSAVMCMNASTTPAFAEILARTQKLDPSCHRKMLHICKPLVQGEEYKKCLYDYYYEKMKTEVRTKPRYHIVTVESSNLKRNSFLSV